MIQGNELKIRCANEGDVNLIMDTWLRCLRNRNCPDYTGCPSELFYPRMHDLAMHLLRTKFCEVACPTHDDSIVVAWICYENLADKLNCIHFAYVKKDFRCMGIMRHMVNSLGLNEGLIYTHRGTMGLRVAPKFNAIFNPFLLMR